MSTALQSAYWRLVRCWRYNRPLLNHAVTRLGSGSDQESDLRKAWAHHEAERATVRGTFERFGTERGWKNKEVPTVLLKNVRDVDDRPLCVQWFAFTQANQRLDLQPGEIVHFE